MDGGQAINPPLFFLMPGERVRAGVREFLVCVEITETDAGAAECWASHIRSCAPAPPER